AAALGRTLAAAAPRVALLVMGDGSAALTESSPGYVVRGATDWQAAATKALAAADIETLMELTPMEGERFLAAGRASWQVLAGAGEGSRWSTTLRCDDAPYGVAYVVTSWKQAAA
ncbi:MAG TPA: hypothetical protein VMT27_06025, partial [Actinomycetes bacterium]|nr:hypothetical protein [Actinomycetes bacterium]